MKTPFTTIMLAVTLAAACLLTTGASALAAEKQPATAWDRSYGGADKSYDTKLLQLRDKIAPRFKTMTFDDPVTGKAMVYSLFIPKGYDATKSYPLVLFMADGSTTGKGPEAPLKQGYGGIIWATDESQAEHPCFVLVPSYVGPENIVNDEWQTSDEVDTTVRLLQSVVDGYSIDKDRLYTTGQSMGGMVSFYLNSKYTDLFAASLFVGSQWDINVLAPLAKDKFFYIVSAGDPKASAGMRELGAMLKEKGVTYGETEFSARLPHNEQENRIRDLLRQGRRINFVQFTKNTVIPDGPHDRGGEHLYSFDYAYQLKTVREWLFQQRKGIYANDLFEKGASAENDEAAFVYYLESAKAGYGPAQAQVGYAYQHGKGVARDDKQAAAWYRKALDNEVERAGLNLGILYLEGDGVGKDYETALGLFTRSWQQDDMKAPRYLGIMWEQGLGVAVDYGKAMDFYQDAAGKGDITAAARIGSLYERGLGVEQSYEKALKWYLKAAPSIEEAARNIHPRVLALCRIGYLYEKGLGVKQDLHEAAQWYRLAAKDDSAEAKAALKRLGVGEDQ